MEGHFGEKTHFREQSGFCSDEFAYHYDCDGRGVCGVDWAGVYYEGGGGVYGVDGFSVMDGGMDGWVDEEMGKQNLWERGEVPGA